MINGFGLQHGFLAPSWRSFLESSKATQPDRCAGQKRERSGRCSDSSSLALNKLLTAHRHSHVSIHLSFIQLCQRIWVTYAQWTHNGFLKGVHWIPATIEVEAFRPASQCKQHHAQWLCSSEIQCTLFKILLGSYHESCSCPPKPRNPSISSLGYKLQHQLYHHTKIWFLMSLCSDWQVSHGLCTKSHLWIISTIHPALRLGLECKSEASQKIVCLILARWHWSYWREYWNPSRWC